jgi:hypothetical protein
MRNPACVYEREMFFGSFLGVFSRESIWLYRMFSLVSGEIGAACPAAAFAGMDCTAGTEVDDFELNALL